MQEGTPRPNPEFRDPRTHALSIQAEFSQWQEDIDRPPKEAFKELQRIRTSARILLSNQGYQDATDGLLRQNQQYHSDYVARILIYNALLIEKGKPGSAETLTKRPLSKLKEIQIVHATKPLQPVKLNPFLAGVPEPYKGLMRKLFLMDRFSQNARVQEIFTHFNQKAMAL